ncbi:hypothetical protein QTG54_010362 [Skeletonema marinoi]|uniref:Uncharacterized protein n=1 Tax=Skeletonema marinoi TaxID=267567 RepID=A0AAD9D9C0_9STRA|nr:hypothetical protein QTG54_010362 [Skeletonema marinoi]
MKKKNAPRATPDEWERRLASILDKSRNSLLDINAKYDRRSKHHALCGIENLHCGPHERKAIEAFQAKVNVPLSRPLSRSTDDEIYRSVEPRISKYVDDKLVVKARAIDALHDQISALSDDIRQLAKDSTRTTKAVSHQERRLDRLSTEFDTRQGNLSNIEASILNEKDWKGKIETELGILVQSTKQQSSELASKAGLASLKAVFESAKSETAMSISLAVSPLQASIKREIKALREGMKEEVSINIQPFQANLMETLKVAVERETKLSIEKELERLQGCIESFKKSKGKVQAFVTSAVETAETNLQGELETSLKEVKRLQKDVGLLRRSLRDDVATDLTTLKEEMAQITIKQAEFMPALNTTIESCRSDLSNSMVEGLSDIISKATTRSKAVDDTFVAIKLQLEEFQAQQREEASRQTYDIAKLFERMSEMEANLLKMTRQFHTNDDRTLSEKVNSLVTSKIQLLEEKIRVLENSQSSINIKESEVWRESLQLLQQEENSRRRSSMLGLLPAASIDEEEEDKLNISEERNRTLSDVARKVLAVASKRGHDPSLVELAKRMQSGKIATPHHGRNREEARNYSSPESETSISTTEALSLCGVRLNDDDEVETPRTDSPTPQPLPSRSTPSPTQSCLDTVLNQSTPEVCAEDRPKEAATPLKDGSPINVSSLSKSVDEDEDVNQPPFTVKEEEYTVGNSSIEGSITSYDEIIEVTRPPPNRTPLPTGQQTGYNPTRLSNPEPYEGWDSLLTELRASGLILRDGNEDKEKSPNEEADESSSSSGSYGSDSFESE